MLNFKLFGVRKFSFTLLWCLAFGSCEELKSNTDQSRDLSHPHPLSQSKSTLQSNTDRPREMSRQDIAALGTEITTEDIQRILVGFPLTKLPWFFIDAKEGGMYIFSFYPSHEVPETSASSGKLLSIIYTESRSSFLNEGKGIYVYPESAKGRPFSGFIGP